MPYSSEAYAYLFDRDAGSGGELPHLRHDAVHNYRTRTVKAGRTLEVEIYPVWKTRAEARRAKARKSREAQKRQNAKNARRKLIQIGRAHV